MALKETLCELRHEAEEWSAGRSWIWRAALLCALAYSSLRHIEDPGYGGFFSAITFGIHELGHVSLSVLGELWMVAGGSLAQLAAPIATAVMFFRQRDYFAIAVAGAWLSFSLYNLAFYMGDARAQQIPLLGLTDDPIHDWNYLLSRAGLLYSDQLMASTTRAVAFLILSLSLLLGGWICLLMIRSRRQQ